MIYVRQRLLILSCLLCPVLLLSPCYYANGAHSGDDSSLVTIKLIIGINLLSYATRRTADMERRVQEDDEINFFGRPPIGEGKPERVSFIMTYLAWISEHFCLGLCARSLRSGV